MAAARIFRTGLALIGAAGLFAAAGGAVFAFGGFYDIAADKADNPLVFKVLVRVREAAITRHAQEAAPFPLDTAAVVQAGLRSYTELGCSNCHGGFGARPARFSEGLNPPPNLKTAIKTLSPGETFWVLKHGIKMTAMPSFGSGKTPVPDADLWSIVALLKAVPTLSEGDLSAWMQRSGQHGGQS